MADFSVAEIREMLQCEGQAQQELFDRALRLKKETVGEGIDIPSWKNVGENKFQCLNIRNIFNPSLSDQV